MSHIEINSNDLTLLSNDLNGIKEKITNIKGSLNTNFSKVKEETIYDNGFNSINVFLDQELESLSLVKTSIQKYQSDINGIEEAFGEKFNNITVPNIANGSSKLAIISPSIMSPPFTDYISNLESEQSNNDSQEKEQSKGSNVLGVLAGAAGVIGAGGLAAAAYMKSRDDKPKEEKTEEKPDTENAVSNIVKEY